MNNYLLGGQCIWDGVAWSIQVHLFRGLNVAGGLNVTAFISTHGLIHVFPQQEYLLHRGFTFLMKNTLFLSSSTWIKDLNIGTRIYGMNSISVWNFLWMMTILLNPMSTFISWENGSSKSISDTPKSCTKACMSPFLAEDLTPLPPLLLVCFSWVNSSLKSIWESFNLSTSAW